MPDDIERPEDTLVEARPATTGAAGEVDGYAAGAIACAVASFIVPIVLAVAALILARASELRRGELGAAGPDETVDSARSDGLVWLARIIAWANIVLVCAFLAFLLLGIAAKVAS